jgi:uncharacterized protein (DUF1778 family)
MGRPAKPEGEKLSGRLEIRVTPEEREQMRIAAESSGKSVSEWIRSLALAAATDK